ncbi:hypothetical protein [Leptolyngbya sp. 7M]|uniref:hypothetical protein n=1 Tax=Leptolyngbya sp. 7M TaxID=2812896 RepID=UPI001B8AAD07|nr:hypothetical protein [Leptolyngbya sp. 7M]QYO62372.1 hypothetical protein JVX88_20040 [Leptolyngbya sp. 7M]
MTGHFIDHGCAPTTCYAAAARERANPCTAAMMPRVAPSNAQMTPTFREVSAMFAIPAM